MKSIGANLSEDRRFRFSLWRIWNETLPKAMVIGLNPSTANESKNDPTINNLILILAKLGYGGFSMVNCFPLVSSDPVSLTGVDINDADNTANQSFLSAEALKCTDVIFAWGNFEIIPATGIDQRWIKMFPKAKCFGKNKNGSPCHPLALMYQGLVKNPKLINYN